MKTFAKLALVTFAAVMASWAIHAQQTIWSKADKTPPPDPYSKYRDFPPLMVDTNTWRLMVDLGTNLSLGDVTISTSTNMDARLILFNGTSNNPVRWTNPVPMFFPTNPTVTATISGTPAVTQSGDWNVGGYTVIARCASIITNATGTNSYAAKDAVTDANTNCFVFPVARANGGSGYITKARLVTSGTNTLASFRIWLYSTAPTTPTADNATFLLLWTNLTNRLGYLDIPTMALEGVGSSSIGGQNVTDRMPFFTRSDTNVIYGCLETLTAFTGITNQQFYIELGVEQN